MSKSDKFRERKAQQKARRAALARKSIVKPTNVWTLPDSPAADFKARRAAGVQMMRILGAVPSGSVLPAVHPLAAAVETLRKGN